ncbi:hypothetical protein [Cellulomonas sp. ATA003]|uniref:hypothetical protein n=1 Tax=Cellulomonas sp. ATA003 TaxID=3073064 RepID=UPI002872E3C9|nr:hypothetical protein [Cellulomonas sp. ATA003]WNB86889.1 hypothetical protein REH70_06920 [Cellulomonas sp. ATA003]
MTATSRIPGVERGTGRSWDDGLRFLDSVGAAHLVHRAIAHRVHEELDGTVASAFVVTHSGLATVEASAAARGRWAAALGRFLR